jgi:hypothetical protein
VLVGVKAGLEHLYEKLQHVKVEGESALAMSDDTAEEVLLSIDVKLQRLLSLTNMVRKREPFSPAVQCIICPVPVCHPCMHACMQDVSLHSDARAECVFVSILAACHVLFLSWSFFILTPFYFVHDVSYA